MLADHLPSALDLARSQFAFTVVWHFLFPAFTIGLASYLRGAGKRSGWPRTRPVYLDTYRYWFEGLRRGLRHGRRVGAGDELPVRHQLVGLLDKTAPVLGPLLGYEVLTAFFLEAGFLG